MKLITSIFALCISQVPPLDPSHIYAAACSNPQVLSLTCISGMFTVVGFICFSEFLHPEFSMCKELYCL